MPCTLYFATEIIGESFIEEGIDVDVDAGHLRREGIAGQIKAEQEDPEHGVLMLFLVMRACFVLREMERGDACRY